MHWHPVVVHFPIALLAFALAVDLFALVRGRLDWHRFAYAAWAAGTVAAAGAVLTGNLAALAYREQAAAAAIQTHENLATLGFLLSLAVGLGRLPGILRRRAAAPRLWIGVAAVAVALLGVASHRGGLLVYEMGVGVRAEAPAAVPP